MPSKSPSGPRRRSLDPPMLADGVLWPGPDAGKSRRKLPAYRRRNTAPANSPHACHPVLEYHTEHHAHSPATRCWRSGPDAGESGARMQRAGAVARRIAASSVSESVKGVGARRAAASAQPSSQDALLAGVFVVQAFTPPYVCKKERDRGWRGGKGWREGGRQGGR